MLEIVELEAAVQFEEPDTTRVINAVFPPCWKYDLTAKDVRYSCLVEPDSKVSPNFLTYSPYEVITVGISTGPFTVGPTKAAPASTAAG